MLSASGSTRQIADLLTSMKTHSVFQLLDQIKAVSYAVERLGLEDDAGRRESMSNATAELLRDLVREVALRIGDDIHSTQ